MSTIRVLFNYLTSGWGNFIPPAVKKIIIKKNDEFSNISANIHYVYVYV